MPRIEPIRILLVTPAPDDADVVRLVACLRDEGHSVVVRAPGAGSTDDAEAQLVHAIGRAACAELAASPPAVPWVATPPPWGTAPEDAGLDDALQAADCVLVRSSGHRDIVHALGVPWYRMVVVPPGVDPEACPRLGEHARRTGRLRLVADLADGRAAVDDVLRAVALMADTELVVLAPDEASADEVRNGVAPAVTQRAVVVAPGSVGERAWWLRSAHLAVSVPVTPPPRTWVLEAMSCGVATIATAVDVLEDVVVHGVTGLHVPTRDAVSLVRAVQAASIDEFTLESLGMAAADRATSRYAWPRIARDLASAYRRLVDRGPATADDAADTADGELEVDLVEADLAETGPHTRSA